MTWRAWAVVALALLVGGFVAGYRMASHKAAQTADKLAAQTALAQVTASEQARAAEQSMAARFAAQAETYEREKTDAQAAADRVADDLRAGNLRLRSEWAGCETAGLSRVAAAAGQPDAATDLRAASASRIVRAADAADAQVRGLQELLKQERK